MKTMKCDGRTFNVMFLVDKVLADEALPESLPDKVRFRVERIAATERQINSARTLYGRVKRQTEKAVLFACCDRWNGIDQEMVGEHWLPLSQVDVCERACGPADAVTVPEWLIKAKAVA